MLLSWSLIQLTKKGSMYRLLVLKDEEVSLVSLKSQCVVLKCHVDDIESISFPSKSTYAYAYTYIYIIYIIDIYCI